MLLVKATGVLTLIKKLWVKFDGMDIECFCETNKQCSAHEEPGCKEYVVKFIEIKRKVKKVGVKEVHPGVAREEQLIKKLTKDIKRQGIELKKSIKKFKVR